MAFLDRDHRHYTLFNRVSGGSNSEGPEPVTAFLTSFRSEASQAGVDTRRATEGDSEDFVAHRKELANREGLRPAF